MGMGCWGLLGLSLKKLLWIIHSFPTSEAPIRRYSGRLGGPATRAPEQCPRAFSCVASWTFFGWIRYGFKVDITNVTRELGETQPANTTGGHRPVGCVLDSFCERYAVCMIYPIGSMYAIYGNIYHQYTPNVSTYTIHGSYGYCNLLSFCVYQETPIGVWYGHFIAMILVGK